MGLMCVDCSVINYIVTAYFMGFGISGLLLFPVPDRWGCKKTLAVFGTMHVMSQFLIIFVANYWVRMLAFAWMGACQLKIGTCYTWLYGLLHSKDKSLCVGILNAWDCLTLSIVTLYFLHVSKHWFQLCFWMSVLGTVSLLFMVFCAPESPKWLLTKGKRVEAIAAFNQIAKINRSGKTVPSDTTFEESAD